MKLGVLTVLLGSMSFDEMIDYVSKLGLEAIELGNTGYGFVKWITENELQKKAIYYIHSMNPTGANAMLNLLKDNNYEALWIPYHLLKLEDK